MVSPSVLSTRQDMMIILYIILALIAGIAVGYLLGHRAAESSNARAATAEGKLLATEQQMAQLQAQYQQQTSQMQEQQQAQTNQLQAQHQLQIEQMRSDHVLALQREREQHEKTLKIMESRFSQLAETTLEKRAEELKSANQESITHLVNPVREDLQRMQQSMDNAREKAAEQKAALEKSIEGLLLHTQAVERGASDLAQALKSNGKMQGDWGEQLLSSILEESGLRLGHEYEMQVNVKDENGSNLRPDVVVNCPGERHIIIDSKVSLTAYLAYTSAQTAEEVAQAEKDNLRSVRAHIDELAARRYDQLFKGALPQVLMFIPNEGSYILAMRTDPQIGQYAYRKGIILINPTNLMLALQMIFNLWQTERQNRNTEKIIKQSADLYDKFVTFAENFDTIRQNLARVQKSTDEAYAQLTTGKGNIVRRLEGLREMGITPKKSMPSSLIDE